MTNQIIKKIQQASIKIQSSDRTFKKIGLNKNQMLELIESINQISLINQLEKIEIPTLVICGKKDSFNLKTSKEIHQLIAHSDFEIIENGKHELNQDSPKELSDIVKKYIDEN